MSTITRTFARQSSAPSQSRITSWTSSARRAWTGWRLRWRPRSIASEGGRLAPRRGRDGGERLGVARYDCCHHRRRGIVGVATSGAQRRARSPRSVVEPETSSNRHAARHRRFARRARATLGTCHRACARLFRLGVRQLALEPFEHLAWRVALLGGLSGHAIARLFFGFTRLLRGAEIGVSAQRIGYRLDRPDRVLIFAPPLEIERDLEP